MLQRSVAQLACLDAWPTKHFSEFDRNKNTERQSSKEYADNSAFHVTKAIRKLVGRVDSFLEPGTPINRN